MNKLVRDKTVDDLKQNYGCELLYRIFKGQAYREALYKKMEKKIEEFKKASFFEEKLSELADIAECIREVKE